MHSIIIGPEHDGATREALKAVLSELGVATATSSWGVAGSQELETWTVHVQGRRLTLEAETYVGLTISGDRELVQAVGARVAERLAAGSSRSGAA